MANNHCRQYSHPRDWHRSPRPSELSEGHSVSLAGLRPVTLSILRLGQELSMALTDSRGLARIGKVMISDGDLTRLAGAAVEAVGLPSPDAVRHAGAALFDMAFAEAVRSFLTQSPERPLQLQVAEELLGIPWEQAFDGVSFLGEKYPVARQILTAVEFPEPRPIRLKGPELRILAVFDADDSDGASIPKYRAALDAIGDISVTWIDLRDSTAAEVLQMLPTSRCCTTSDKSMRQERTPAVRARRRSTSRLSIRCPRCWSWSLTARAALRALSSSRAPWHWRASGQVSITSSSFGGARPQPDFARSLYSAVAAGQPLARAVSNARRLAHAHCTFYGDGTQTPFLAGPAHQPG